MIVSRISPKPIIARVAQTWDVPPGLKVALVEDVEQRVWIVESCPAGTHFWTLAQASELPQTGRAGYALRAAVDAGRHLSGAAHKSQPAAPALPSPVPPSAQPLKIAAQDTQEPVFARPGITRSLRRTSVRRANKVAVCA